MKSDLTPREMKSWMKKRKLSTQTTGYEAGLHQSTVARFLRGEEISLGSVLILEKYRSIKERTFLQTPEPPHAA